MVIVDSCVWSEALRKKATDENLIVKELRKLILEGRVVLLNPIRQELLSGIREKKDFEALKLQLSAFPGVPLDDSVYEVAAEFFNRCRAQGIQGSNTDYLICAAGHHLGYEIFTTDQDFESYKSVLGIQLMRQP